VQHLCIYVLQDFSVSCWIVEWMLRCCFCFQRWTCMHTVW